MRVTVGQRDRLMTLKVARTGVDDGYGSTIDVDEEFGSYWCRLQPLKGSETVIAARMTGVQPVIITIPWEPELRGMTPTWRAYDEDGIEYDIKSVSNMDEKRQFLECLAEKKT